MKIGVYQLEADREQQPVAIKQSILFSKVSKRLENYADVIMEDMAEKLGIENEWTYEKTMEKAGFKEI